MQTKETLLARKLAAIETLTTLQSKRSPNLLHPLALLIASNAQDYNVDNFNNLRAVQRDAWYNVAAHGLGLNLNSSVPRTSSSDLVALARNSPPLIGEELAGKLESDIELNTVLRRHMGNSPLSENKKEMAQLLPSCESDIRDLSYPELTFLKAAYLLETSRASAGDCTKVPIYFVDSHLRSSHLGRCMEAVAYDAIDNLFGKTTKGLYEGFSAPYIATQLSLMFERCCHGVDNVQDVAYRCVDRIISQAPSVLCHRLSIFALLDLLTIMWSSCLEADTDEYGWRSEFSTLSGSMKVQLSDDYGSRRYTLRRLQKSGEAWIMKALNIAPLDVKGILQVCENFLAEERS